MKKRLERRHAFVEQAVDKINEKYGQGSCEAIFVKQYENMETVLKESPAIVNDCRAAFDRANIKLTEMKVVAVPMVLSNQACRGLPCPDTSAGPLTPAMVFTSACQCLHCMQALR